MSQESRKQERVGPGHPMFRPIAAMLADRTNNPALMGHVKGKICEALAKRLGITSGIWEAKSELVDAWEAGKITEELVVSVFEPVWQEVIEVHRGAIRILERARA